MIELNDCSSDVKGIYMAPSGRGAAAGCRVILLVRDVQTPRTVFVYQKEAETEQCVTHPKIKQLNYFTVYIYYLIKLGPPYLRAE